MLCDVQDAERRQAEARAKQQQRQKEMEAAQQEAQERRQLLEEQKLLKLAGPGHAILLPTLTACPCMSQSLGRQHVTDCTLHCMQVAFCVA